MQNWQAIFDKVVGVILVTISLGIVVILVQDILLLKEKLTDLIYHYDPGDWRLTYYSVFFHLCGWVIAILLFKMGKASYKDGQKLL